MTTATAVDARAARHSKESAEWFTPIEFIESARKVLCGIDLDPASCPAAQARIRAETWYGIEHDGLAQDWRGNVFLNPPGGLVYDFWEKLVASWNARAVVDAIWIGYSLEQLQTLQRFQITPLDFPFCVTRRRIAFDSMGPERRSPTHGNYVTLMSNIPATIEAFQAEFAKHGRVVVPSRVLR